MKNQRQRVLDYLKRHGKIDDETSKKAIKVKRLSARIGELRDQDHNIKTVMVKGENEFGPYEYAQYHYIPPEGKQINAFGQPKPQRNKAYSI